MMTERKGERGEKGRGRGNDGKEVILPDVGVLALGVASKGGERGETMGNISTAGRRAPAERVHEGQGV